MNCQSGQHSGDPDQVRRRDSLGSHPKTARNQSLVLLDLERLFYVIPIVPRGQDFHERLPSIVRHQHHAAVPAKHLLCAQG